LKKNIRFLKSFQNQIIKQQHKKFPAFKVRFHHLREVASLRIGDSFGEYSLLSNKSRNSTCYAKKPVTLARLSKADYLQISGNSFQQKIGEAANVLQKFDIFSRFSRRKLEQFYCYYMFELNLRKGQYLFREGDTYLGVFFIVRGRCEKLKED
jgi:CRP-like cAMP-binding protein